MVRTLVLLALLPAIFATGCGGEEGGDGGSPDSGEPAPLAPLSLAKKTTMNEYRLTMQAPEGSTAEWSTVYFFVRHGKDFALRVTPNHTEDLAAKKKSYEELNIKGFEVLMDEPDALLVRVDAHSGTDFEVFVNKEIGGVKYAMSSVGIVGGSYSRAQAERLLACCRTLAAAE
jgi:hypothetical protein